VSETRSSVSPRNQTNSDENRNSSDRQQVMVRLVAAEGCLSLHL
jgi:hypothetical protein